MQNVNFTILQGVFIRKPGITDISESVYICEYRTPFQGITFFFSALEPKIIGKRRCRQKFLPHQNKIGDERSDTTAAPHQKHK